MKASKCYHFVSLLSHRTPVGIIMFHQLVSFFVTILITVVLAKQLTITEKLNSTDHELMFSKVDSRLNIASNIIETARQQLQTNLRQMCLNNSCRDKVLNFRMRKNIYSYENPRDCSDIYLDGYHDDGIYKIWPQCSTLNGPLYVYCDMKDGDGWTVIQRRGDFGNAENYFFRDWNAYKMGFGHLLREFWIGNDNLFGLTSQRPYQLRFDLADWEGNTTYAIYNEFWIDDESFNYTLHVNGYNGAAGDSFQLHNGKQFSTKDRDNDLAATVNCADIWEGAWWFAKCYHSNLNGISRRGPHDMRKGAINWATFRGNEYSLKSTVMKIRPAGSETNNVAEDQPVQTEGT